MVDIVSLLHCLHPTLSLTTIRQLSRIGLALPAMTGRVTMLGISRWTERGEAAIARSNASSTPLSLGGRCSGCCSERICTGPRMCI